jgi:hypothetical protein
VAASDYRSALAGPTGFGSGLGGSSHRSDLAQADLLLLAQSLGLESALELGDSMTLLCPWGAARRAKAWCHRPLSSMSCRPACR